ncbi:MAG: response regulator [Methanobacteriota archaeon]
MTTILYVDDEPALLDIATLFLEKNSEFKVLIALSAQEGLEIFRSHKPEAVVSDFQMPVMDGMELLKKIRKISSVPFIMFTGRGNEIVAMEAINNGADYYIQKGADPRALFSELTYKLRLAISGHRSDSEEQRTKKTIRTLIDKTYNAVIIQTPEGRIFDVNDTMLKMFHLTREEALTYSINDLTGPGAPTEKRTDIISRVLAGEDQFLVWEARRPHDGSVFPIEKFLTRINFGPNIYILSNIRDISEIIDNNERDAIIQHAIHHVPEGIICSDIEGHIRFINTIWSDRLGLDGSDKQDMMISLIDPSLTPEVWNEYVEKCQRKEEEVRMSVHRDHSGREIPVEITSSFFQNQEKKYVCMYIRERHSEG